MFHVGAWHQAPVYANKPGCTPAPKIYTEVEAVLVDTGACFGVGLEPTLNMVCSVVFIYVVYYIVRWLLLVSDGVIVWA